MWGLLRVVLCIRRISLAHGCLPVLRLCQNRARLGLGHANNARDAAKVPPSAVARFNPRTSFCFPTGIGQTEWNVQAWSRLYCMIRVDHHPPEENLTMSQNKTASRKDDRQLRGKEARPPAKDDATKMPCFRWP